MSYSSLVQVNWKAGVSVYGLVVAGKCTFIGVLIELSLCNFQASTIKVSSLLFKELSKTALFLNESFNLLNSNSLIRSL